MAMTRLQYLLGKLAEECGEVAERALKAQAFGLEETRPGTSTNNADLIFEECNDVEGIKKMLADEFGMDFTPCPVQIANKIDKVNGYYFYSINCGMCEPEGGEIKSHGN
ncbi:MAG: hypothetical protein COA78_06765 [Blastopirellula sp.]|nr:MAG: hypothetical protein COA78_06765 [Blastopirellula sp.]